MVPDILIPLIVVGLAELGDKTQLSTLLLASKTDKHLHLLLGIMLAFLIVDGIAILAGEWITAIAPRELIKMLSGVIFILFGFLTLIFRNKREENHSKYHFENPFYSGFILIFVYINGRSLLFVLNPFSKEKGFTEKGGSFLGLFTTS